MPSDFEGRFFEQIGGRERGCCRWLCRDRNKPQRGCANGQGQTVSKTASHTDLLSATLERDFIKEPPEMQPPWHEPVLSLPDTTNGKCPLFLATGLAIERQASLCEVVIHGVGRIAFRCGPVETVGLQPRVLGIAGAAATEQGIESGAPSHQKRQVRRFTGVRSNPGGFHRSALPVAATAPSVGKRHPFPRA